MAQNHKPRPPKPDGIPPNPRKRSKPGPKGVKAAPSLMEVARQRPSPDEFAKWVESLDGEPDRIVAITFGALLEALLEDALTAHMLLLDPGRFTEIFREPNAPLQSWSAKTLLAHALGIFGDAMRVQMDQARRIRNAFAHALRTIDFENEAIAAACAALDVQRMVHDHITYESEGTGPRARYMEACMLMAHHLVCFVQAMKDQISKGERRKPEAFRSEWA